MAVWCVNERGMELAKAAGMIIKRLCYTLHGNVFQFREFYLPGIQLSIWGDRKAV